MILYLVLGDSAAGIYRSQEPKLLLISPVLVLCPHSYIVDCRDSPPETQRVLLQADGSYQFAGFPSKFARAIINGYPLYQ